MSRPTIIINDLDAERIDILLEQPAYAGLPIADALNAELDRAQMCSPEEMPHDVVTMNSRVKFRNLSDGEVRVRTLVYPAKMTDSNTQLSVMAPVGAALLGLRVGDSIHWELPGGVATHLEVLELEYQPESCWRLPALIPSAQAITRFAQRMHSHPLYAKSAIFPGSHCSLLLQNYSVSFVGITMAEAFYILIGFLIMAAIIVMAVLYLENHS